MQIVILGMVIGESNTLTIGVRVDDIFVLFGFIRFIRIRVCLVQYDCVNVRFENRLKSEYKMTNYNNCRFSCYKENLQLSCVVFLGRKTKN